MSGVGRRDEDAGGTLSPWQPEANSIYLVSGRFVSIIPSSRTSLNRLRLESGREFVIRFLKSDSLSGLVLRPVFVLVHGATDQVGPSATFFTRGTIFHRPVDCVLAPDLLSLLSFSCDWVCAQLLDLHRFAKTKHYRARPPAVFFSFPFCWVLALVRCRLVQTPAASSVRPCPSPPA